MKAGNAKSSKEPVWITLKEGDKRLYVLTHPDPAYHERFVIDKVYLQGYKTPHYKIYDKIGRSRAGGVHVLLRDAKLAVNNILRDEQAWGQEDLDVRTVVYSLCKREQPIEALMRILDYIDAQGDRLDSLRFGVREIKTKLRNV